MAELTRYQLQPRAGSGFHFGRQGLELEESGLVFPSDSFYSALVATVAEQEGAAAAAQFVAPFLDQPTSGQPTGQWPPFRLTSLFPYVGRLPLFPLPRRRLNIQAGNTPRKLTKTTRFVSPAIFRAILNNESLDDYLDPPRGLFLQDKAIWLAAEEQAELPDRWTKITEPEALTGLRVWNEGFVPAVRLDRVTSASNIYHVGRLTFNQDCGLWLGVRYDDSSWRPRLEGLLHHLADVGIGGERSTGYGAFCFRVENKLVDPKLDVANDGAGVLLSRWLPRPEEIGPAMFGDNAAYQLTAVGGWLTAPFQQGLRRKRIHLVSEGSVVAAPVSGRVADIAPDPARIPEPIKPPAHPIYRFGLALTAAIHDAGEAVP